LPTALTSKHGVVQQDLFKKENTKAISNVIYDIASTAHSHIDHCRKLTGFPPEAIPAFLPTIIVDEFLKKLQREDFNIFAPSLARINPLISLKLYYNYFRKSY